MTFIVCFCLQEYKLYCFIKFVISIFFTNNPVYVHKKATVDRIVFIVESV